jgi:hypothetical protein
MFKGLGIAFAAAVVLFSAFAASATAQTPPYTAYGIGQTAGAKIAANIAGKSCGEATVAAAGTWLLPIPTTAACAPKEGDTVSFTINGAAATQTVKWTAGGAPADAAKGIALTAGAAAPAPAKTGDAGLLGSTGTSMALVLMMGIAAAALVAGARTATRER